MEIQIDGWKVNLRFSAAHFIPSHSKCSRLHGHDYAVMLRIYGEAVDGILMDFVEVKKAVREIISDMDHKLLVPERDRVSSHSIENGECTVNYDGKRIVASVNDVYLCETETSSSEELSALVARKLVEKVHFGSNISRIAICVEEGPGQGAFAEMVLHG